MAMSIGILELLMARTHLHAADGFWAWPEGYRLVLPFGFFLVGFFAGIEWSRGRTALNESDSQTVREKIP